jgi:hypothetical protein
MRRSLLSVVLALATVLTVAAGPAGAGTVVDQAIAAIDSQPVFVADGAEGTDSTTQGVLTSLLNTRDHLAIVMLPASAHALGSAQSLARRIDDATKHQYIVAVTIGTDEVAAASTVIPSDVPPNFMHRADSVSTNTVETLQQFIRYVHDWEGSHPEVLAKAPPPKNQTHPAPAPPQQDSSLPWWFWAAIIVAIVFSVIAAVGSRRRSNTEGPRERKLPDPPDPVKDQLDELNDLVPQVTDTEMSANIRSIHKRVRALFDSLRRNTDQHQVDLASDDYKYRLGVLRRVIEQYIEIQNDDPLYWRDAQRRLRQGKESVATFNASVLDAIQSANDGVLLKFDVDQRILDAIRR